MIQAVTNYVEQTPEGVWRVFGSRVSLDSVLAGYLSGLSPEGIEEAYPSLSLEAIHGCLTFYLRNRAEMDAYLQHERDHVESLRRAMAITNQPLIDRLRAARCSPPVTTDASLQRCDCWPTRT